MPARRSWRSPVGERGERCLAGRGDRRRQAPPDLRRQADRLAAVVSGQIGHLEPVEHGELDRLLRRRSAGAAPPRRTPGPGRLTRGRHRRVPRASARVRTPSRSGAPGRCRPGRCRCWRSTTSGARAGERVRSVQPPGPAFSASRSRIAPARVTAGARDSLSTELIDRSCGDQSCLCVSSRRSRRRRGQHAEPRAIS